MCRLSERLEFVAPHRGTKGNRDKQEAPMFGVMSDMLNDRFCAGVTSGPAGQKGPSSIQAARLK